MRILFPDDSNLCQDNKNNNIKIKQSKDVRDMGKGVHFHAWAPGINPHNLNGRRELIP